MCGNKPQSVGVPTLRTANTEPRAAAQTGSVPSPPKGTRPVRHGRNRAGRPNPKGKLARIGPPLPVSLGAPFVTPLNHPCSAPIINPILRVHPPCGLIRCGQREANAGRVLGLLCHHLAKTASGSDSLFYIIRGNGGDGAGRTRFHISPLGSKPLASTSFALTSDARHSNTNSMPRLPRR